MRSRIVVKFVNLLLLKYTRMYLFFSLIKSDANGIPCLFVTWFLGQCHVAPGTSFHFPFNPPDCFRDVICIPAFVSGITNRLLSRKPIWLRIQTRRVTRVYASTFPRSGESPLKFEARHIQKTNFIATPCYKKTFFTGFFQCPSPLRKSFLFFMWISRVLDVCERASLH